MLPPCPRDHDTIIPKLQPINRHIFLNHSFYLIISYWSAEPSIPDIQADEEGEGEGGEGEAAEDPSAPTPATEPATTPAPEGAEGDDAKGKKGHYMNLYSPHLNIYMIYTCTSRSIIDVGQEMFTFWVC